MAAVSPLPSLSQIRAWDTYHLADAATDWRTAADHWEETFSHVAHQMPAPGGIPWEGNGAEAAQLRASTDLVKVRGLADSVRSASTVAANGADEIYAARQSVLYAVEDAEGAGFTVGEDLSVTSRHPGGPPAVQAARQAQAAAFAADIRGKAAAMTATDQEVAAKVTTAAAGLRGVTLGDGQSRLPIAMPRNVSRGSRRSTGTSGGRDRARVANRHRHHRTLRSEACLPLAFGHLSQEN
jgi:hypothetical protein